MRIPNSVYQARPGVDQYRPDQATPVPNLFLAGDYTQQEFMASIEGAVRSAKRAVERIDRVGDWGLGDWGLGAGILLPIPSPQSPVPTELRMLPSDTTIHDRYRIIYVVDERPGSTVYRGRDEQSGRLVLVAALGHQGESRADIALLARQAAATSHAALLPVVDHFEDGETYYVICEDIGGQDLERTLRARGGPLPESATLTQARRMLDALEYLHRQKPPLHLGDPLAGDIWIGEDGAWHIAPFTLIRPIGHAPSPYRARELDLPTGEPNAASDLYALCAMLYQALTGWAPPTAAQREAGTPLNGPRALNPNLSTLIEQVLLRGLQLKPENRYQVTREMRQSLEMVDIMDGRSLGLRGRCAPRRAAVRRPTRPTAGHATRSRPAAALFVGRVCCAAGPAGTGLSAAARDVLGPAGCAGPSPAGRIPAGSRPALPGRHVSGAAAAARDQHRLPGCCRDRADAGGGGDLRGAGLVRARQPAARPARRAGHQRRRAADRACRRRPRLPRATARQRPARSRPRLGARAITLANAAQITQTREITGVVLGPVAYSPDGKTLAVGISNLIDLRDAETLAEVEPPRRLAGHTGQVFVLGWSPDSKLLASGAMDDPVIRLWNASDGRLVRQLEGHTDWIRAWLSRPMASCWLPGALIEPCGCGMSRAETTCGRFLNILILLVRLCLPPMGRHWHRARAMALCACGMWR